MAPDPHFRILVETLYRDTGNEQVLSAARTAIAAGEGTRLFRALIDPKDAHDEYAAIERAMLLLERLMATAPSVAEYLMIKLYGAASPLFMHHVGDAIENWLAERARPELAAVIRALASEETDALVKKRMLEWAASMP